MQRILILLLILTIISPAWASDKKKFVPERVTEETEEEKSESDKDKKKSTVEKEKKEQAEEKKEEEKEKEEKKRFSPQRATPEKQADPELVPVKPEPPKAKPEPPKAKPEPPKAKPESPKAKPKPPVSEPETPKAKPETEKKPVMKTLLGTVYDIETREPIPAVEIKTNLYPYPAKSRIDGTFRYPMKLEPGKHTIYASSIEYKKYEAEFVVDDVGEQMFAVIYLAPLKSEKESLAVFPPVPDKRDEIQLALGADALEKVLEKEEVEEKEEKKPKTTKKPSDPIYFEGDVDLSDKEYFVVKKPEPVKEKIRYIHQKHTDIIPHAVATAPFTAYGSGLIMGGAAPYHNSFFIDGIRVPFTHHIMTERTILDKNFIKSTELHTGAFGPEYGDSLGGIINIKTKNPREDKIGGSLDLSMFGVSGFAEGPMSTKDFFSASFNVGLDDIYTRMAYGSEHSVVSPGNFGGHALYHLKVNSSNTIRLSLFGAKNSIYYSTTDKSHSVPNLGKTLSPDVSYILAKGDYIYESGAISSRLTGSFLMTNWDYSIYGGHGFGLFDNRGTLEEHLGWKINENNRLDAGVTFMAGVFTTEASYSLLPLEGEPGVATSLYELNNGSNIGYIHPSVYLKYTFSHSGFKAKPGVWISGDFHNKKHWSGSIDPRLMVSQSLFGNFLTIYGAGGLYTRRPQYDITLHALGREDLEYEKSVHGKAGFKIAWNQFSLDVSGFYKYFYDLIRRNPEDLTDYGNYGKGWAAGTEIKAGYSDDEVSGWVSYTFTKSMRKDFATAKERRSDADIPHIFKAAISYKPHRNWVLSANTAVISGFLATDFEGTSYLFDAGIYVPQYELGASNNRRMKGSYGYGVRVEYIIPINNYDLGLYGDFKGSGMKIDRVYNADYTDRTGLYLTPFLGTFGVRGEF